MKDVPGPINAMILGYSFSMSNVSVTQLDSLVKYITYPMSMSPIEAIFNGN